MNKIESTIPKTQALLSKKRQQAYKLAVEINTLVGWLQEPGACDHSSTEDYKWEWDSGYGRQRWNTGRRCVFCGYKDLWNRGVFSHPDGVTA